MEYTTEQLDAMAEPCQALLDALETDPLPDVTGGDPSASLVTIRHNRAAYLARLRHLYPIPSLPEEVTEQYHSVKARDGYDIPIKITRPKQSTGSTSPIIVLYHEGGWCLGDFTDEDHDAWLFSRDLNAVCVNVEYRLAPEHVFPAGVNDCHDVLKWVAGTASPESTILPADPRKGFIVGGSSAGANLSAVMCQIARDEGLQPPITGQYLSVAALLAQEAVPKKYEDKYRSRWTSIKDPILNLSKPPHTFLLALKVEPSNPRYSPLLHPNLRDLPPAYFQICGVDPLRDESLLYVEELQRNGVQTKFDMYKGLGHMFWTNWPKLDRSKNFFSDTLRGVKWLLELTSHEQ